MILSCKSAMEKQILSSLYVITDTFYYLYSWILRITACTTSCSSSSSICAAPFVGNHTYVQFRRTRTKVIYRHLLRCIHDRLAFDDVAAHRSCGSYWRQLSASLAAAVASACCQICACTLPLTAQSGCNLSALLHSWLQPVMLIGKLSGKNGTSLKVRYPGGLSIICHLFCCKKRINVHCNFTQVQCQSDVLDFV